MDLEAQFFSGPLTSFSFKMPLYVAHVCPGMFFFGSEIMTYNDAKPHKAK